MARYLSSSLYLFFVWFLICCPVIPLFGQDLPEEFSTLGQHSFDAHRGNSFVEFSIAASSYQFGTKAYKNSVLSLGEDEDKTPKTSGGSHQRVAFGFVVGKTEVYSQYSFFSLLTPLPREVLENPLWGLFESRLSGKGLGIGVLRKKHWFNDVEQNTSFSGFMGVDLDVYRLSLVYISKQSEEFQFRSYRDKAFMLTTDPSFYITPRLGFSFKNKHSEFFQSVCWSIPVKETSWSAQQMVRYTPHFLRIETTLRLLLYSEH
jgi:hypothetical protein